MDLLEKLVYNYIKNNHGVITFRDMEELNFFDEDEDTDDYEELENVNSEEIVFETLDTAGDADEE